jgi:glucose/arabinose dehydrogenase
MRINERISCLVAVLIVVTLPAGSQTFPSNFTREQVGGTLSNPTVMAFAPDGRIFVAEQSGTLRVIKNGTQLTTPFITLTVNSSGERGLIGIAFDPDFATNNFIYLYYTINTAPLKNRISRFTANGDVALEGSEQLILELDNLSTATNHNGGALAFGLDGKLYVAVGDNANTSFPQNLDTYHGKILRINKDGSAPSDNPFFSVTASEQRKRIWAYGLRNPYTFSIQPGTGKILVNDVGQNAWEEINDASVGGRNFGWPTSEGPTTNPLFTSPLYAYNHNTGTPRGCAITGGTYFNPVNTNYPNTYVGKFFFQDYCSNWIYFIDPTLASPPATLFGTNVGGTSLSIMTGTDGNLYYLSRAAQRLYRIKYTTPTIAPSIIQQPTSLSVSVGQSATFSVTASGTAPLAYQWQKNGVNITNAIQSTYTISSAQLSDGGNFQVVVSNSVSSVTSNTATPTVTANQKPNASILTPAKNTLYTAGTSISFSGLGTDPEQGDLPASAFSWEINFHHDTHKHDQPAIVGVKQSAFDIPNQGETSENVWYRIILTVKDAEGLEGKDSVDVFPRKSTITFETIPTGLQLTLDGQPFTSPKSVVSVQGILRTIGVVNPQTLNNTQYQFDSWVNAGAAEQTIATPAVNTAYVARFSIVLGTEDLFSSRSYPNPASDWIHFHKLENSEVSIHDKMGGVNQLPVQQSPSSASVYVGHLTTGLYFISSGSGVKQKVLIHR